MWINNTVVENSVAQQNAKDASVLSANVRNIQSKKAQSGLVVLGAVVLMLALFFSSCIGIASKEIPITEPILKVVTRQQLVSIVSVFFASFEWLYLIKIQKIPAKRVYRITKRRVMTGCITGSCFFLWMGGLVFSSNNTIQSHAYIFNSFGGTFIVAAALIMGKNVHRLEVIGSIVALSGAFLTLLDGNAQTTDGRKPSMTINGIDLVASGFGAIYFSLIPKLKTIGPLFFSIMVNSLTSMIFGFIFASVFFPESMANPL